MGDMGGSGMVGCGCGAAMDGVVTLVGTRTLGAGGSTLASVLLGRRLC